VRKAIHILPEDQRAALILSYYEDLAQKEIAEVMKCSVKSVELKIYRARQTLREVLSGLTSC
jgi:RNA polymerase sigma-70 factor (ECF subfamily)